MAPTALARNVDTSSLITKFRGRRRSGGRWTSRSSSHRRSDSPLEKEKKEEEHDR
jgi:hypothetical protein